jgi:hypothetical protein
MTFRRALAVAAVLSSAAFAPPAASFDEQPMNELTIGSSQRSVAATAAAGCIRDGNSHTCSGTAGELPLSGTLFVRPGHQIALDFDWPVEQVHVTEPHYAPPCANCMTAGQPASLLELHPVGGSPSRRWEGSLPAGLPRGFVRWSVHAQYDASLTSSGNRNFEAGVWVLRSERKRVLVPRLVGRTYVEAIRELERRGLRWRRNRGPLQFDTGAPGGAPAASGGVTAQSKKPGTPVNRGGTIRLTVAEG